MFVDKKSKKCKLSQVGGKAYNLYQLRDKGLNIPKWLCLTTEFFDEFLGEHKDEYAALLKDYNEKNRQKIVCLIDKVKMSDDLKIRLDEQLKNLNGKLAVRSSATDEDGVKYSFAGMLESSLNVEKKDLEKAIKDCYKSCFSERVMQYRLRNNLDISNVSMAVLIMEMVDAEHAGVIFTSNPQTNNPDEVLISVVAGLGESLVSGEENSTNYIVNVLNEITSKEINGAELDNEMVVKLAKLARKVESFQEERKSLDIEFAIKSNKIYILQSRKITSLSHINKNLPRTILDNSNIIESYSGITTPLTYTFAREVYGKIYHQTLRNFYVSEDAIASIEDDLNNMLFFYENKIYYKLNSWYKMTSLYPGYNKNKKYMENMMGVKTPLEETNVQAKKRLYKIYVRFIYKMMRMKKDSAAFLQKFNDVTKDLRNQDFEGKTNLELIDIYQSLETNIIDDFTTPIANDMGAMVFYGLLTDKMSKVENGNGLISKVLSKQGNVESVKQATGLIKIVEKIKSDPELLEQFKNESSKKLVEKLQNSEDSIFREIRKYIEEFGARSTEELKLETITLSEDPAQLFEIIKKYLEINIDKPAQNDDDSEELLLSNFKFADKKLVATLVKITKYFVRNRELLRLRRTYIYDIARRIFLALGRNFQENGDIDAKRDIFFMEKDEVFALAKGKKIKSLKEKIKQRKAEYNKNADSETHERMYFYGEVKPENMIPVYSAQEKVNDGNILSGTPGGGEVVEGVVKFITSANDHFESGYILMAKRTDPGWTVLFPIADAIIVERGSVLSHSAVVAREMGKTLVVGVRGLTDKVKDGDRVRVDGIKGSIEILNEK